ncbi:MAG: hypothetical protein LBD31_11320 [Treponema sp.]|jgi:hypothetical protein|nr:hypothetical protein [Treponema sp.]
MDELFSNILYFIPIAFIIAIRFINARNKQQQKPPPKPPVKTYSSGPADRSAGQVLPWPDTRQSAVKKPPAVKKIAAAKRTAVPQKTGSLVPKTDGAGSLAEQLFQPAGAVLPAAADSASEALPLLPSKKLTPLQQALVWSEILGPPRSEQPMA